MEAHGAPVETQAPQQSPAPDAPAPAAPVAVAEAGKDVAAPAQQPAAGAMLTEDAAVAIFVAKQSHTTRDSLSCKLASQYGITSKSVRGRRVGCPPRASARSRGASCAACCARASEAGEEEGRAHARWPRRRSRRARGAQTSGTYAHGAGRRCHTGRQPTSVTICPRACAQTAAAAVPPLPGPACERMHECSLAAWHACMRRLLARPSGLAPWAPPCAR